MQGHKFVIIFLIGAFFCTECLSSSIPMFEFLSRDEKVRKMFVQKLISGFDMKGKKIFSEHEVETIFF